MVTSAYIDNQIEKLQNLSNLDALAVANQIEALWLTINSQNALIEGLLKSNAELRKAIAPVVVLPEAKCERKAFVYSDGGRAEAGYKGQAGDCVVRAIANATGKPYQEVYDGINALAKRERKGKRKRSKSSARDGVYPATIRKYMNSIGWTWYSTMGIGTGCIVHLRADELPAGRLVVCLSKHYTALIEGSIYDTYDPSRDGTRCVYGYYMENDYDR